MSDVLIQSSSNSWTPAPLTPTLSFLWACFWAVPLACVCWYKWLPNTFMSSRFAGKTPGLRFDRELFGRVGAAGSGGGGGALGKDTMMEVGRLPALLLWPSATGLQREHRINVLFKRSVLSQETASFIVWKRHRQKRGRGGGKTIIVKIFGKWARKEREEKCSQYEQTIHPVPCASLTKPVNQTTVREHSSKGARLCSRWEDIYENSSWWDDILLVINMITCCVVIGKSLMAPLNNNIWLALRHFQIRSHGGKPSSFTDDTAVVKKPENINP